MYTEKVQVYLLSILPAMGYGLDSVSFTNENNTNYLRAFIFREDGQDMGVNDCATVSRRLSKWLDKEDFIPDEYILEVCSLGFKDHPGDVFEGESYGGVEPGGQGSASQGQEAEQSEIILPGAVPEEVRAEHKEKKE